MIDQDLIDFAVETTRSPFSPSGIPHHSLYVRGRLLVMGTRKDLQDRFALIDQRDVRGRSILDLDCHFGSTCFLAAEAGARDVIGLDTERALIDQAQKLSERFEYDVLFARWEDYNDAPLMIRDTVFAFTDRPCLRAVVAGDVVYVETHTQDRHHLPPVAIDLDRSGWLSRFMGAYDEGRRRLFRMWRNDGLTPSER